MDQERSPASTGSELNFERWSKDMNRLKAARHRILRLERCLAAVDSVLFDISLEYYDMGRQDEARARRIQMLRNKIRRVL